MASSSFAFPQRDVLATDVAAAQRGDHAAVDRVLTGIRPWGVRYFANAVSSTHAEDLAQDLLIAIAGTLARGTDGLQPAAASRFVQVVAWNLARQAHRRSLRRPTEVPLERADDVPVPRDDHDLAVRHDETARVLAAGAVNLSAFSRSVLLWDADGWTAEEIARHLGRSPAAVMKAKSRALRTLRRALRAREGDRADRAPASLDSRTALPATGERR